MILTEEEAKTKRCQESYGPPASEVSFAYSMGVGIAAHTSPLNCIGSACMAWRRDFLKVKSTLTATNMGYCGKAGRPDDVP